MHPAGTKKAFTPNRQRRWHPECLEEWKHTSPQYQRDILLKRDRGVCATCGLDTIELAKELNEMQNPAADRRGYWRGYDCVRGYSDGPGCSLALELGFDKPRQSFWEADHVVELQDGGANHTDNMVTVCQPCHRAKTAQERKRRARNRRQGTGV